MPATLPWAEGGDSPWETCSCSVLNGSKDGGKVKTKAMDVKTKAMDDKTKAMDDKTKAMFYVFPKDNEILSCM